MFDSSEAEFATISDGLPLTRSAHLSEVDPQILAGHIAQLWEALPNQSRKRLSTLAVSVGVGVTADAHAELCGALEMIAEAEGTLEREAEFAQYLGLRGVCEAIAAGRPPTGVPRKEQKRLAAERRRERDKAEGVSREREYRNPAREKADKTAEREDRAMEKARGQKAIAIDGEGVTLEDGSHIYRYMAACTSDGVCLGELYDEEGICTRHVLDFLDGLPKHDEDGVAYLGVFGYGLGYDTCKWLERLKNRELFDLFHAEDLAPKASVGPYRLNMLGKCLQITNVRGAPGRKRTLVWDILKAFQATFVNALRTWKVGTSAEWTHLEAMKKQRGDFVNTDWASVTAYCRDECRLLAMLVEKYVRAHCEAGINLRGKYHGAGSTGDAFLLLMHAPDKRCSHEICDDDLLEYRGCKSAFSRAFFGGRAEISRLGVVKGPIYSYDIGSAYPHALYSLPCVKHGKWHHITENVARAAKASRLACVHYTIVERPSVKASIDSPDIGARAHIMGVLGDAATMPWGALPYRTDKSSIVFPATGPGGWVWEAEYEAARRNWPGVEPRDAWCLKSECQCEPPYRQIGEYYLKRLEWGKEGPGMVLKLGMNSCYGKFAQVIGNNPKYACRVVAGYITAACRARILEAIASAEDPWSVVYVATDGILTDRPISPPDPIGNDTKEGAQRRGKVMLGAWESTVHDDTYFLVQPGFYFSVVDDGKAKTRGMPLEIVNQERARIIEQWRQSPLIPPRGLPKRSIFRGVKTSILRPSKYHGRYRRKPCYGRWEMEERVLKYIVNPKRAHPDPISDTPKGPAFRLMTWWLYPNQPESAEYAKDPGFGDAKASLDEQPDFVETPGTNVGE
jgi:hypothetical protein